MTWGVLRPVILLPAGVDSWPRERLRARAPARAGAREAAGLPDPGARPACLRRLLVPPARLDRRAAAAGRERARLRRPGAAIRRAGLGLRPVLLEVARGFRPARGLAAAAVPMARPSQLEGRLRAILDPSRSRRVVTRRGAYLLLAAAAVVLLPLSIARLEASDPKGPAAAGEGKTPARSARMTVSGRVLDPDGRPVAGAKVAILGRRKLAALTPRSEDQHEVLGQSQAGADGRFRLEVPRTSSLTHYELHALAARPGFGLGWAEMNRDADAPEADVRLLPEQSVEGRLVDLQGVAASGVMLRISSIGVAKKDGSRYDGINLWKAGFESLKDVWPAPARSDAEGRFRLAGIGRGVDVGLSVEDPRFARQGLRVRAEAGDKTKRPTLPLQPAMRVTGRVTCADTGARWPARSSRSARARTCGIRAATNIAPTPTGDMKPARRRGST